MRNHDGQILIKCRQASCPRKRWTPRTEYDPPNAAYILLFCPWHEQDFDEEDYYDEAGNIIKQEPDKT